tara:strand:+ start:1678 stop:1926 length:249 start_codon:yes stop_codon:yes gene_type:complete
MFHAIIEFDSNAAPVVMEKQWNDSVKYQKHKDGWISMRITVSHLEDLKNEILSWGHRAKVIEPLELKQIILEEIVKMTKLYE